MSSILFCSSCGEDIKLIQACSWRTSQVTYCTGTEDDFIYSRQSPAELNEGECQAGVIRCRREVYSKEEFCGADQSCLANWSQMKTDDICVGSVWGRGEECDGLDNDCDGEVDEVYDSDNDGFKSANHFTPNGEVCGTDCNDRDPLINPNAAEMCNGADDNCNGVVDEGLENIGVCHPEVPANIDPSTLVYEGTACSYETGTISCENGAEVCNGASFVGPSPEICDGRDNDCNGLADEPGSISGIGAACGSDVGVCVPGYYICNPVISDMMCVDSYAGETVDLCDGLDNDCDTETDEDAEPILCTNGCPTFGYQYCRGGEYSVCDAPLPGDESLDPCNGIDDDCDGAIDEGQQCQCDPAEIGPNAPDCSVQEMQAAGLTCGKAKKDCECRDGDCQYGECYLACDPRAAGDDNATWWGVCDEEVCDGWDHDCDGGNVNGSHLVDVPCSCDPNSPIPAIAQAAVNGNGNCELGACTAGTQTCEFDNQINTWVMSPLDCGAIGPEAEVCDEVDNDCDGPVDEDLFSFDKVDMVFAIDITGSMREEIQAVHDSISAYAQDFDGTHHRFALLLFPAPPNGSPAAQCDEVAYHNMSSGLVDVNTFLNLLVQVLNNGLQCGQEPSYDVLYDLSDRQDPAGIGWRPDAYPYVFLIGDEAAQSWQNRSEADVAARTQSCAGIGNCPCLPPDCPVPAQNFEIHCFVERAFENQYNDICETYDINAITPDVLRNIFADVCLP